MIIAIMFVAMLLFFVSAMFIKNKTWRITLSTIFALIFVISTGAMTANYSHHFGMHQATSTQAKKVFPIRNGSPLAIYQPLGTDGTEQVLIYKKSATQSKSSHTPADEHTKTQLKFANRSDIKMVTKTTRWRLNKGWASWLFKGVGMDGKVVKKEITITYPKSYIKVTAKQAQQLAKQSKAANSAQAQAAAKSYIMAQVQKAKASNPQMNQSQLKQVQENAQMQYQAKLIRQMLNK